MTARYFVPIRRPLGSYGAVVAALLCLALTPALGQEVCTTPYIDPRTTELFIGYSATQSIVRRIEITGFGAGRSETSTFEYDIIESHAGSSTSYKIVQKPNGDVAQGYDTVSYAFANMCSSVGTTYPIAGGTMTVLEDTTVFVLDRMERVAVHLHSFTHPTNPTQTIPSYLEYFSPRFGTVRWVRYDSRTIERELMAAVYDGELLTMPGLRGAPGDNNNAIQCSITGRREGASLNFATDCGTASAMAVYTLNGVLLSSSASSTVSVDNITHNGAVLVVAHCPEHACVVRRLFLCGTDQLYPVRHEQP